MATSPQDQSNRNVREWLSRMQDSVRTAGSSGGPNAFDLSSRGTATARGDHHHEGGVGIDADADDSDGGDSVTSDPTRGPKTIHGVSELQQDLDGQGDGEGVDKLHTIPDAAVPLGLIANLALGDHNESGRKRDDKDDDDNVVCRMITFFFFGGDSSLGMIWYLTIGV